MSLDLDSAGRLWAGANDGLFRWDSVGMRWQPVPGPFAGGTVLVTLADARNADVVYAGATDSLWKSTDGGVTWNRWGKGLEGVTVTTLALNPRDPRRAVAGTRSRGLYATDDGGVTWHPVWTGPISSATVRAVLYEKNGASVYVATDQGLWRGSSDAVF